MLYSDPFKDILFMVYLNWRVDILLPNLLLNSFSVSYESFPQLFNKLKTLFSLKERRKKLLHVFGITKPMGMLRTKCYTYWIERSWMSHPNTEFVRTKFVLNLWITIPGYTFSKGNSVHWLRLVGHIPTIRSAHWKSPLLGLYHSYLTTNVNIPSKQYYDLYTNYKLCFFLKRSSSSVPCERTKDSCLSETLWHSTFIWPVPSPIIWGVLYITWLYLQSNGPLSSNLPSWG